jgi:hypothetical protein
MLFPVVMSWKATAPLLPPAIAYKAALILPEGDPRDSFSSATIPAKSAAEAEVPPMVYGESPAVLSASFMAIT